MFFDVTPPPVAYVQQAEVPSGVASTTMTLDEGHRPLIEVAVNGHAPQPYMVDLAAQGHFIDPSQVEALGLVLEDHEGVAVAATGSSALKIYRAATFKSPAFTLDNARVFSLGAKTSDGTGIVGMADFAGKRLIFDYEAGRFSVEASRAEADGFSVVPAKVYMGTFIVIEVEINGVKLDALVDTGAGASVINAPALLALGFTEDDARLDRSVKVGGASGDFRAGGIVPDAAINIGGHELTHGRLIFSAMSVFETLGYENKPLIILGNDILPQFSAFGVDYGQGLFLYRLKTGV